MNKSLSHAYLSIIFSSRLRVNHLYFLQKYNFLSNYRN